MSKNNQGRKRFFEKREGFGEGGKLFSSKKFSSLPKKNHPLIYLYRIYSLQI